MATGPELSLVIPVYNGSRTIGPLVEQTAKIFGSTSFEIVLVNDGSEDDSERVCVKLAEKFPQNVTASIAPSSLDSPRRAVVMSRCWTTTVRIRPRKLSECWTN